MENPSIKNLLFYLFEYIADTEKKISNLRNQLYNLFCFDSKFGYFNYLDKNKKGYIEYEDIKNFLMISKVSFKPIEIKTIIKNYDRNFDHVWNFDEFLLFIYNNSFSFNESVYSGNYLKNNEISNSIEIYEKELANLFKYEIEYLHYCGIKVKSIKELMKNESQTVNSKFIFDVIRGTNNKINSNVLFIFLNDKYHTMSKTDVDLIVKRLNSNFKEKEISYKKMEEFFNYDRFIRENDTQYFHSDGYYKANTINYTNTLYYNIYTDKMIKGNKIINDLYNPSNIAYSMPNYYESKKKNYY